MRRAVVLIILWSTVILGDDYNVDSDLHVDFSKIKTFRLREGKISSARPELSNSLVPTRINEAVRAALTSKGLKETAERPDVFVEFDVSHVDYSVGPFGVARPIAPPPNRGGRGRGDATSTDPVGFVEGVLVIDMTSANPELLIWRGVYRDTEKTIAQFSEKLPDDAKKLLSEYPPRKKK